MDDADCPTPAPASASGRGPSQGRRMSEPLSASGSAPHLAHLAPNLAPNLAPSPITRSSPRLQHASAAAGTGSVLRAAGTTPRGAGSASQTRGDNQRTPRASTPSASSALLRLAGFTSPMA